MWEMWADVGVGGWDEVIAIGYSDNNPSVRLAGTA